MTDVLDLIDGALRDYDLSSDAMRWSPDPVVDDEPVTGVHAGHLHIRLERRRRFEAGSPELRDITPTICGWLKANGFNPNLIPLSAVPVLAGPWIYCERMAVDGAGRIRFDKQADDVVTVVERRARRVEPPDELWPWLTAGDATGRYDVLWRGIVRYLDRRRVRAAYSSRVRRRHRR